MLQMHKISARPRSFINFNISVNDNIKYINAVKRLKPVDLESTQTCTCTCTYTTRLCMYTYTRHLQQYPKRFASVLVKTPSILTAVETSSYIVGKSIILFTMFYCSLNWLHYLNLRKQAEKEQDHEK